MGGARLRWWTRECPEVRDKRVDTWDGVSGIVGYRRERRAARRGRVAGAGGTEKGRGLNHVRRDLVERPRDREDALVVRAEGTKGAGRKVEAAVAAARASIGHGRRNRFAVGSIADRNTAATELAAVDLRGVHSHNEVPISMDRTAGASDAALGVESGLEKRGEESQRQARDTRSAGLHTTVYSRCA